MIEMYTARISEIDEIDEAINDIKQQIDLSALKKNSGGLVFCHMDFIESGMMKALCAALPFNVIGMTSLASAEARGYSLFDLTLTVLTSDEVSFEVGMTNPLTRDNYQDEISRLYSQVRQQVADDPAMIISFAPYIHDVAGYQLVDAMDAACAGIPLWGSITSGVDFNYERVKTFCNGKHLREGLAMMFINGSVEPKFIVSSLPERNIRNNRALVTQSEGAILREINGLPVIKYLESIGLSINKDNVTALPMMVYYEGFDAPVALGFYTLFDDGSVLTGAPMPIGASFSVGSIDVDGILESAASAVEQIEAFEGRHATLLLPCVTRYLMLAPDQESEFRLINEKLSAGGKPFMMGYSGGEICPTLGVDGKLRNRFHNYSFCACVL